MIARIKNKQEKRAYLKWKKSLTKMTREAIVEECCELSYLAGKLLIYICEFEKEVNQKVKNKVSQKALPKLKAFREYVIGMGA